MICLVGGGQPEEAEGEVRGGPEGAAPRAGEGRGGQEQVLVRDREGSGGHGEGEKWLEKMQTSFNFIL